MYLLINIDLFIYFIKLLTLKNLHLYISKDIKNRSDCLNNSNVKLIVRPLAKDLIMVL